jgi:hypothetical protein
MQCREVKMDRRSFFGKMFAPAVAASVVLYSTSSSSQVQTPEQSLIPSFGYVCSHCNFQIWSERGIEHEQGSGKVVITVHHGNMPKTCPNAGKKFKVVIPYLESYELLGR